MGYACTCRNPICGRHKSIASKTDLLHVVVVVVAIAALTVVLLLLLLLRRVVVRN